MNISANTLKKLGAVKPMHGVGQPPFLGANFSLFKYLTEASIPYSRLHDVGGWLGGGLYVDIPNLFRDFDADENEPESYDFAFTDRLLKALSDAGVEPFFRLGVTIENSWELKSYRIYPPKDMHKWARICEHVVRHYNEGWADGYHMNIRYWEIWNEPDNITEIGKSCMWRGTPQQYYELYEIAANHLKKCFGDAISVGGFASCGMYAYDCDPNCDGNLILTENASEWRKMREFFIQYMHDFFRYITSDEHKAPIDFFSWHIYSDVYTALKHERYVRKVMSHYGLDDVPDILNEWNTCPDIIKRASSQAAAGTFAFLLAMQKERVAEMNFYDARLGPSPYGGLFNPSTWQPYLAYYAFKAFGSAYDLGTEFETDSDSDKVFVVGACGSGSEKHVLLLANVGEDTECRINFDSGIPVNAEIIRIDDAHTYEKTEETLINGCIFLPANSCVEIKF